jgi:tagaturonate reductase
MKMRNLPILLKHYSNSRELPSMMALGFAAHLLFMKCEAGNDGKYYGHINGADYVVQDDNAAYFAAAWKAGYRENLVKEILSDAECWGQDLHLLPNFAEAVDAFLQELINGNIFKLSTVNQAEKLKV